MTTETLTCPVCEIGKLHASHYNGDFKHNGKTVHVTELECYRCNNCDADPVFEDQIRSNHRKIADAKRRIDGLLTGNEIKAIRESLNLSQSEAAEIFGGGLHAFSKYERGDVLQSKAMDKLLRLIAHNPFLISNLRVECGMEPLTQEAIGYMEHPSIQLDLHKTSTVRVSEIKNGEVVDNTPWETSKAAA